VGARAPAPPYNLWVSELSVGAAVSLAAIAWLWWLVRRGRGMVELAWSRLLLVAALSGAAAALASWLLAPPAGAAIGATLVALSAWRVVGLVRFTRLCGRLADPDERGAALADIERDLEALRPAPESANSWTPFVQRALYAVAAMINHEIVEPAERLLASLPRAPLTSELEAQRVQYQAVLLLRRGELEAARAALRCAPDDLEEPTLLQALEATSTLLLALERRSDEALLRIAALGEPLHAQVAATIRYARVHALAVDDPDGAREIIEEVFRRQGRRAVERIRCTDGPATALCDAILQEHVGPYR
jgi:hypothetical protein